MGNEIVVDVLHSGNDLLEVELGLMLVNVVVLDEVVELPVAG